MNPIIARDLQAAVNPAYGAVLLREFCAGYGGVKPEGAPFPLLFLVSPMVLSDEIAERLGHGNSKTRLLDWVARNAGVLPEIPTSVRDMKPHTRSGLCFGLAHAWLSYQGGLVLPGQVPLGKRKAWQGQRADHMKLCARLGGWFAQAGSPAQIYGMFGMTP